MKIVYLAAGAAEMYCGSCLHDNTLAAALLDMQQDVMLVPTYTPLRTDEENVSDSRLFFGGINVYLQQQAALFRHTPWFFDALLNRPGLIRLVTRGGPSVEPKKLGALTVSMLEGEQGRQSKEIEKLVHWLRSEKPDVVHLSNAMLLGMAREIRKLGPRIVCSLSGEDVFLEKLSEPHYSQARQVLRERAADADAFVAFNRYYAGVMVDYLAVDAARVHVIQHGLNLAGHGTRTGRGDATPTVGYFARICADKGLHNLVAAAELLIAQKASPFRVRAAGYMASADRPYLETILERTRSWPAPYRFEYAGEVSREGKIAFLQSLDCMSLPTVYREAKGISAIEALANAVPVLLPNHGAFPELVEQTGGGWLHEPLDPAALAGQLKHVLANLDEAHQRGLRGQEVIRRDYTARVMAQRTLDLYQTLSGA